MEGVMPLERSYMFVPGNDTGGIADALESVADVVILDLEDTVRPSAKDSARASILDVLADSNDNREQCSIRVNGLDTKYGIDDVEAIATTDVLPNLVLVPDVRDATEVRIIDEIFDYYGVDIGIHPLLEKPSAFFDAHRIAQVSERVHGLMFAAIDFQMNMGMSILDETDLSVPQFLLSMAASDADVLAIDKPNLADVYNRDRTRREAQTAKAVGYNGKAAMTAEQAEVINEVFTPSREEVDRAKRFINAFEEADEGVTVIDGVAVDKPVISQLRDTVARARTAGMDV